MSVRRALIGALLGFALTFAQGALAAELHVEGVAPEQAQRITAELTPVLDDERRDGDVTVSIDGAAGRAKVRFVPKDGAPIEREVAIDDDPEARVRTLRWLLTNILHDEASELLGLFRHPKPPEPDRAIGPQPLALPPPAALPLPASPSRGACEQPMRSFPFAAGFFGPLRVPFALTRNAFTLDMLFGDFGSLRGSSIGVVTRWCDASGVVISVGSIVRNDLRGVALATGFNAVTGEARGALISSGFNLVIGRTSGLELAPVNIGTEVMGAQIGIVNAGGRVAGLQLGILNVAADADAQIGLLSISWLRRVRLYAQTGTHRPLEAGVLFEGRRVFSFVDVARIVESIIDREPVIPVDLGVHLVRSDDSGVVWDLMAGADWNTVGQGSAAMPRWRARTRVGYRFARRWAPFLYGGVVLLYEGGTFVPRPDVGIGALL